MALTYRTALTLASLMLAASNVSAQSWPPWADDTFSRGPAESFPRASPWDEDEVTRPPRRVAPLVQEGGARPEIAPKAPPLIAFPYDYPANSIVIDTGDASCTTFKPVAKPTHIRFQWDVMGSTGAALRP